MIAGVRQQFATVASFAPRSFWVVWWGTLVNRLGGFVIPLLTIYLIEVRKLSVAEAGGIVSVFGAGNMIASFVGGQLTDRLGRRATMLVSLFGGAAAMAGLAFMWRSRATGIPAFAARKHGVSLRGRAPAVTRA